MNPKFVQALKWVGIVDGAIAAAATVVAGYQPLLDACPQAGPAIHAVIAVTGFITTAVGAYAHITRGSQTVVK